MNVLRHRREGSGHSRKSVAHVARTRIPPEVQSTFISSSHHTPSQVSSRRWHVMHLFLNPGFRMLLDLRLGNPAYDLPLYVTVVTQSMDCKVG